MADELYEHEHEEVMTREQAAARLREIADQLSRHNEVRVVDNGRELVAKVPDRVTLEVELELGEEPELEITIGW